MNEKKVYNETPLFRLLIILGAVIAGFVLAIMIFPRPHYRLQQKNGWTWRINTENGKTWFLEHGKWRLMKEP